MNKILMIAIFGTLFTNVSCAQNLTNDEIITTINAFSSAGDKNDTKTLDKVLDDNFRIVMNRLFGSTDVSVMDKSTYLEKIKSKEYGGDNRILNITEIVINGNTASAKVQFKGTKMTFISLITLIKNTDNKWLLIQDLPIIK